MIIYNTCIYIHMISTRTVDKYARPHGFKYFWLIIQVCIVPASGVQDIIGYVIPFEITATTYGGGGIWLVHRFHWELELAHLPTVYIPEWFTRWLLWCPRDNVCSQLTFLVDFFLRQNEPRRPFWRTENHFRLHFSPFKINTQPFLFTK